MSRIRAAAIARLAAVEQAGDVLRANFTTARQWLQTLGATDQPLGHQANVFRVRQPLIHVS